MKDLEKVLVDFEKMLSGLGEKGILSYWIFGEYEEAGIYWKLAETAEKLGLPASLVGTFRDLAKESEEHGDTLKQIYVRTYGEEPQKVDLPYIEAEVLAKALEDPENMPYVLKIAMETELVARRLYERLAEITGDESARKVYRYLADVEWTHYLRLKGEAGLLGITVEVPEAEIAQY